MPREPENLNDADLDAELAEAEDSDDPEKGYGSDRQRGLRAEKARRATNPHRTEPGDWQVGDIARSPRMTEAELADALAQADAAGKVADANDLRTEQHRREREQSERVEATELAEAERERELEARNAR